jgi:hypothetical protein
VRLRTVTAKVTFPDQESNEKSDFETPRIGRGICFTVSFPVKRLALFHRRFSRETCYQNVPVKSNGV